jgi:DNA-binding transcriptional LysR family regulator
VTDHNPTIRLGYHGSPALPEKLAEAGQTPAELHQYDITDPFRALRAGELDVMIVKFRVAEPDLTCSTDLATDPRAVVVGAAHPLASRASLSVEELPPYAMFHCPRGFPPYVWDEVVPPTTPAGRPLRRQHDLPSTTAMIDLVADGRAVHLSVLSLADIAPPAVKVIPVRDLPPAPVALAWCRERAHVRAFVTAAESALAAPLSPTATRQAS